MADSRLPALTEISAPVLLDELYVVDVSDTTDHASGTSRKITSKRLGGLLLAGICQGRLTLESGVAVSTSDQTSKTSIYFTPFNGNKVAIYDGTRWILYTFTELTLALGTLSSGLPYDVFLYDNAGTLTLEALAWTNATTRATALTTQDGVLVKTGATTRLYLGTFYTTSTTTTEDSLTKRFLWNNFNSIRRPMRRLETTDSWTYSTATWRAMNNSTSNRLEVIVGLAGAAISVNANAVCTHASSVHGDVGIGYDSITANVSGFSSCRFAVPNSVVAGSTGTSFLNHTPELGYHYYQALEAGSSLATQTWYGDAGAPATIQVGIRGEWEC